MLEAEPSSPPEPSEVQPPFDQEEQLPLDQETEPAEAESAISTPPLEPVGVPGHPAAPQVKPSRSPSPASVQEAIEQVRDIVVALEEALDDMQGVQEMLERFERQKEGDEREIEALRRSLRHLQRPRESGHPPRGRP